MPNEFDAPRIDFDELGQDKHLVLIRLELSSTGCDAPAAGGSSCKSNPSTKPHRSQKPASGIYLHREMGLIG